jgi:hypothetical protein
VGSNLFNNLQNQLIIKITYFPTIFPLKKREYSPVGIDFPGSDAQRLLRIGGPSLRFKKMAISCLLVMEFRIL